jgi:hypothetical protein
VCARRVQQCASLVEAYRSRGAGPAAALRPYLARLEEEVQCCAHGHHSPSVGRVHSAGEVAVRRGVGLRGDGEGEWVGGGRGIIQYSKAECDGREGEWARQLGEDLAV